VQIPEAPSINLSNRDLIKFLALRSFKKELVKLLAVALEIEKYI